MKSSTDPVQAHVRKPVMLWDIFASC